MVTISTAGEHEQSPLGQMRAGARRLPLLTRDGKHLHARSGDRSFALHEWALDAGDDTSDLQVVKQANPASWQTIQELGIRMFTMSQIDQMGVTAAIRASCEMREWRSYEGSLMLASALRRT